MFFIFLFLVFVRVSNISDFLFFC